MEDNSGAGVNGWLIVVGLYMVVCIAVGVWAQKRNGEGGMITALSAAIMTPLVIGLIVLATTPKGQVETDAQRKMKYSLYGAGGLCLIGIVMMMFYAISVNNSTGTTPPTAQVNTTQSNTSSFVSNSDLRLVTKEQFGNGWPFTKNEGYVDCVLDSKTGGEIIDIEFDGIHYALNGLALTHGAPDLPDRLWLKNSSVPGLKKDISPIQDRARDICRERYPQYYKNR